MKKIIFISLATLFVLLVFAQQDVDNFRGKKWDTPYSQMSAGLSPSKSKTPGFTGYEKANENYNFEGITAHTIIYLFKKELFVGVSIGIYNKDVAKAVSIFTKKYGEPRVTDTPFLKNYEWYLKSSVIVVSYFPTNQDEKSATIGIRKPK